MSRSIETRVEKLEKTQPKHNPMADMTLEELEHEIFLILQEAHKNGIEEDDTAIFLRIPKCRQFAKGEPWLNDYNHRLDVFLGFRQLTINQSLPDQQRVDAIFCLGWGGNKIPADDIEWLLAELKDFDLGDEGDWLRGYLECSGNPFNSKSSG